MAIGTIPAIPQWIPRAMRAMMAVPLKMSIAILSFISCSFLITLQRYDFFQTLPVAGRYHSIFFIC